MANFLLSLAEINISMAAVILLLLLIGAIFGKRYTAKCRYIIWMIVIVRLCIPIGTPFIPAALEVEIPLKTEALTETQTPLLPETAAAETEPAIYEHPDDADAFTPMPDFYIPDSSDAQQADSSYTSPQYSAEPGERIPAPDIVEKTDETPANSLSPDLIMRIICCVWLAVACVIFLRRVVGYCIISAKMRKELIPPTEESIRLYSAAALRLGIKSPPPLMMSCEVHSPMLCGFIKPIVIVPDMELSDDSMTAVLSHELTHFRRGDLWIKLLCALACALNWFDPLVYIAAAKCNREMELSCDEAVLRGLDQEARVSYGNVMLDIIKKCSHDGADLTTHFNPRRNAVMERFQGILDNGRKKRGLWMIAVVTALCILAGTIIACTIDSGTDETTEADETNETEVTAETAETAESDESVSSEAKLIDDTTAEYLCSMISESGGVVTLLAEDSVEGLKNERHELSENELRYIIEDSIRLYFGSEKIVLPSLLPLFEEYPKTQVTRLYGAEETVIEVLDFPLGERYNYLINGREISPIDKLMDDDANTERYGVSDINGDAVIDENDIAESIVSNREMAHFDIVQEIYHIILYRIFTLADLDDFTDITETGTYSGIRNSVLFETDNALKLVFDSAYPCTLMTEDSTVLYPTPALDYDTMLEAEENHAYLDAVIKFTSQDGVTTCSLLSAEAEDKLKSGKRRDLTTDEIKHLIESSVELYFSADEIVFPSLMPVFDDIPTKTVTAYDADLKLREVEVPDFDYAENLAYLLLGDYSVTPIHTISERSDDALRNAYIDSDLSAIQSSVTNIICYRFLTFADTEKLTASEYTHPNYGVLPMLTYPLGGDTLVLDDGTGTIYLKESGEVLYPTADVEYDAIIKRQKAVLDDALFQKGGSAVIDVRFTEVTPEETADMAREVVDPSDIEKIVRESIIEGTRIFLYIAKDSSLCAAYAKDDVYTRFLILSYSDAALPEYSLDQKKNILGTDGFSIGWNWSHYFKCYYTLEDGEPKLLLSASDEIIEADCDLDGVKEVIQKSSVFTTLYDSVDGKVVRAELIPDHPAILLRYNKGSENFEYSYERNEGEGKIYVKECNYDGKTLEISDKADTWWNLVEQTDSIKLQALSSASTCDGAVRILRFVYNDDQVVFGADCYINEVRPSILVWDYNSDGIDDCRITYSTRSGAKVYLQYDGAAGGELYEIEPEETIDGGYGRIL